MTQSRKPLISVIMGSVSDSKAMKPAVSLLKEFQVPHEVKVVSAHRTPAYMKEFAETAKKRGVQVIIAGAGGSSHLPGMTASFTEIPVIGIPVKSKNLRGLDSLLSIAQMPKGIPVATMGINNSANGALLAIRILALTNQKIQKKLTQFQKKQKNRTLKSNSQLKDLLK